MPRIRRGLHQQRTHRQHATEPAFSRAFGDTVANLVFGARCRSGRMLPTAPLVNNIAECTALIEGILMALEEGLLT